ncbi:MAG: hypothetical protein HQM03_11185 [Magnetococcales bacterium]|nr:hypothetical protein [Magnetococcales bacterium]
MKLFSRKPSKPGDAPKESVPAVAVTRLLLHVGPGGWESCLVDADGMPVGDMASWDATGLPEIGFERISLIIRNAAVVLKKDIKSAHQIALMIDGIGVLFTDNHPKILNTASPPTARQYGQQWLNVPDVTFGQADFPSLVGEAKTHKNTIYAFADAQVLRNALALFDKDGIKMREAVPTAFLIIQRAALKPVKAYGAIYFGFFVTTLVFYHYGMGALVIRTLPIGYLHLIHALAQGSGISLEDTMDALQQKDYVAEVDIKQHGDTLQRSMQAKILAPHLTQLLHGIKECLEYFTYQRIAGTPDELEIFGAADRIHGLTDWLARRLGIPCQAKVPSVFSLFRNAKRPMACNLLKGAETSLFSIGRNNYYFSEKQGFVRSSELAVEMGKHVSRLPDARVSRNARSAGPLGRATAGPERRSVSGSGASLGELFGRLTTLFRSDDRSGVTAAQQLAEDDKRQEQIFFTGFGGLVALLWWWGVDELMTVDKKFKRAAHQYVDLRTDIDQQEKSLGGGMQLHLSTKQPLTKVLWSEKFLALANNVSEHIWLTDVYLERDSRAVGENKVESKKLVVKGGVLPSTDGHILKVANYLDNLLNDKKYFMSDFRMITFSGSHLEQSEADPIVRFTFEAWYDKNVRIEKLKGGDQEDQPGLAEMNQNIEKHNSDLNDLLTGSTSGKRR